MMQLQHLRGCVGYVCSDGGCCTLSIGILYVKYYYIITGARALYICAIIHFTQFKPTVANRTRIQSEPNPS